MRPATLRIRPFRGPLASEGIGDREGFLITGVDGRGRDTSVFTYSRPSAEQIKRRLAAGKAIGLQDFAAEPGGGDRP